MKKLIALILALTLLLCGCAAEPAPTTQATEAVSVNTEDAGQTDPTTEGSAEGYAEGSANGGAAEAPTEEATEAPTTEPAEVVYTNPLSGEILEEPYTGRIFAATISNVREAIPHVGLQDAEIVMEMFVNNSVVRCLALYTDITATETVGPIRSMRLMFNDLIQHYDLLPCYAGGSNTVMAQLKKLNVDHVHVDEWESYQFGASFRDKNRTTISGLTYENTLMLDTDKLVEYAVSKGATLEREERDYGLHFTEDGTPAGGEAAQEISIRFQYKNTTKDTIMKYDEALDRYVYWQYGKMMTDGETKEPETFRNVIVMDAHIGTQYAEQVTYYTADFLKGGSGYYACGGQIIPITWTCEGEDQPFHFFTQDGEPLQLGVGNSYIAIVPQGSPISYK